MTVEELAKLLGIDKSNIQQTESKFVVSDVEIGRIDETLWLEEMEIEFWLCNFESTLVFPKIKSKLVFSDCTFKDFLNARGCVFERDVECRACDFEGKVDFSSAEFQGRVNFSVSRFKNEARFIETKFQAQATDSKTIENDFREAQFEGNASFDSAEFQGRVNFSISRFKNEARFIETKFQAQATNGEIIENNFRATQFEGKVDFSSAEFQGRVNFSISRFKNEARFINAKFQAQATDSKTIENDFREAQFEGNASFDSAEFQGRVNFSISRFKNEARFINAKFQAQATDSKTIENDFRATHFDGDVLFTLNDFKGKTSFAMTKFAKDALWSQVSFHQVFFRKTIFEASSVWRGVSFEEEVAFDSVYFGGKTSFCSIDTDGGKKPTTFKKAGFKNVVFKESDFSEVEFVGNARFNGVVFKDLTSFYKTSFKQKADFRGSIFGGITSFDEADFGSKKPDFLNCTFGNQFNIEHQHLHYEYDDIENEIKNETNTQERKNPSLWRDLFRRLKSNRLAYHNLIDASELRAQELYAREIELEEKVRENKASFKEKIEKWQLCFYRLTSDHHTDLAKIFNNVILLIALFGIFAFGSIKYGEKHLDYERRYFGSVETSAIDLSTRKTTYSLTKSELKTEKQDLQNLSWNQNNFSESFSIVFLCLAFVVSFGALISLDLLKNKLLIKIRNIFFYLLVFGVLIFKPTLLLPFIGKFLESSSSTSFPAMQSLSVVYCILMFLMLFSLQKTARKNSIIPS